MHSNQQFSISRVPTTQCTTSLEMLFTDSLRRMKELSSLLSRNMQNLESQLNKETLYEKDSNFDLRVIKVQFEQFIHSKVLKPSNNNSYDLETRRDFKEYTQMEAQTFKETIIQNMNSIEQCIVERTNHEQVLQNGLKMLNERELPSYDTEPMVEVSYTAEYNVFAVDTQHSEQPECINNTCVVETGNSNVILDSPDMCDNYIQNDQNIVECDDEHDTFANLIANLKLDVDENKKIQKQLKKANASLTQEWTECKSILAETSRTLRKSNSIRDSCLVALQIPKGPTYNGKPTFANPRYLKQAQSKIPCLYAIPHDQSYHANRLIPDREETLTLERESRSKLNKDLNIAIIEFKKLIEKMKDKSVDTKFEKPPILGKLPLQPIRNQPVPYDVNAPVPFRKSPKNVSFQTPRESVGSDDMVHNYYLKEAKKKAQLHNDKALNTKPSVQQSARLPNTANELNSRASAQKKDAQSLKTIMKYMPVEKKFDSKKHDRQIPIGQKLSPNKSSNVYQKTTPPISCHRWKPTGRIFKTVGLRWVPTGNIFNSSTTKVDNEPLNCSNEDITNHNEYEQTLDVSTGTLNLSACTSFNPKKEGLRVWLLKRTISNKPGLQGVFN
nr:hypothetical protein [Tanacetum cinerariifolium]